MENLTILKTVEGGTIAVTEDNTLVYYTCIYNITPQLTNRNFYWPIDISTHIQKAVFDTFQEAAQQGTPYQNDYRRY